MADGKDSAINLKTIIVLGIVMILIAGATSYGLMTYFNSDKGEEDAVTPDDIGPTYTLGDFVVNLAGSGGYQYIRASIVVEVDEKRVVEELDKRSPQLRDIIITILREQKLADIEEPGARVIKNQIVTRLNQVLSTGKIKNVWFTQFVVQ